MTDEDHILDLLAEWDEQRRQGQALTPEQLVPDDVAVQQVLRERIAKRQRLSPFLDPPTLGVNDTALQPAALPQLPDYEILEVLGRGGMGVVYKARQKRLDRLTALKMILAGPDAIGEEKARFRTEAEAVARLHHPNIVQIYEVGEQDGRPYLALEYVGGGSLAQQLHGEPMAPRRAAQLVLTLAQAVQHAHEHGVIHRDLKPANILLTTEGTPKIADFGLAKRLDLDLGHTQTGAVLGSPSYMSPEQAAGKTRQLGPATDIYALGVVLYELLTGKPPFRGNTLLETLEQVRHHDPAPLTQLLPALPRDLETICLKCLEKEPEHRYSSAAALAHDLQAFLADESISARTATTYEHLRRTLYHKGLDANWRAWSTITLTLSPVPFLVHLTVFALFHDEPEYPFAVMGATIATILLLISIVLSSNRASMQRVPARERRHVYTIWISQICAFLLVPTVLLLVLPWRKDPELLLVVYPLWIIVTAVTLFGLASNLGLLYIPATIFMVTSVLMALKPSVAPLIAGALASGNLLFESFNLSRLRDDDGHR
ncbi:MAG: serine/threonine protein kinase [Planctomycetia bacterium]|nr:serine/threonine protein kinase [Planctomycetia bacterium]